MNAVCCSLGPGSSTDLLTAGIRLPFPALSEAWFSTGKGIPSQGTFGNAWGPSVARMRVGDGGGICWVETRDEALHRTPHRMPHHRECGGGARLMPSLGLVIHPPLSSQAEDECTCGAMGRA